MVTGDFNGDGNADIYAVQNSFAPVPVVGRFDGGLSLLLESDGDGHFTPVRMAENGLIVTGEAKALASADFNDDGWADFLVTRNGDTTLVYRNEGIAGQHSLRVALQGNQGNPTGIGTRVTIELEDGSTQTSEVYAGSGYYSQSSAALFFGFVEGNPPRGVRVRWPTGAATAHRVSPTSQVMTIAEPAID